MIHVLIATLGIFDLLILTERIITSVGIAAKSGWTMMKTILHYGSPLTNNVLTTPTIEVEYLDKKLHHDIQQMSEVLKTFGKFAAGLAANQIGKKCRVFIYHDENTGKIRSIINPYIIQGEGKHLDFEGCLSFPHTWALIPRYTDIKVKFVDFYTMSEVEEDFTAFEARLFQHEIEHLDGRVFIENLSEEERNEFMARYVRTYRSTKDTRR